MLYERLGGSGLDVSRICLGAMMFGGRTDKREADAIVVHARDAGVNFIDTADSDGAGVSEGIVGRTIADAARGWIVAANAGNRMGASRTSQGPSRRWLTMARDDSLRRLGTDWIELYCLHIEDHATPLEETVGAIGSLIAAGKIRSFGVSNFRALRIAEIRNLWDRMNVPRPVACQPYCIAINCMPEVEVLPACAQYGLGAFA